MQIHTHEQLVGIASKWLQRRHSVVITELATNGEAPDALGWRGWHSTLVECKVSAADFRADARKYFRAVAEKGIGQRRWYMAPTGIIKVRDLPHGWGLLEVSPGGRIKVVRKSTLFRNCNSRHEVEILLSALKRCGLSEKPGISVRQYVFQTKCRATLGLAQPAGAYEQ